MSESVVVWMLLQQGEAALLARRKPDVSPFPGLWTLPGDVMTESESADETITRICREHLDVTGISNQFLETLNLKDSGFDYAINVFRVAFSGHPRFRESGPYLEVSWVRSVDLAQPVPQLSEELRTLLRETLGGVGA